MILTWQEILLKNPSWAWLSPCPRMPLMTKPGFLSQSEGSHFSDVLLKAGKWNWLNHVWLFVTPWTVSHQAPQAMEFSRPEYWSGLPFPPPGDLPNSETESLSPMCPALQVDSLLAEPSYVHILYICLCLLDCDVKCFLGSKMFAGHCS